MRVPGFILRRLYVKGSLRNMPGGFQFQLQNNLGSGQARKLMPLTVDGDEMPMDRSFFTVTDGRLPFDAVSEEKTFSLEMNLVSTIQVEGISLDKGTHKIGMGFVVAGLGDLVFDFVDEVQEE